MFWFNRNGVSMHAINGDKTESVKLTFDMVEEMGLLISSPAIVNYLKALTSAGHETIIIHKMAQRDAVETSLLDN